MPTGCKGTRSLALGSGATAGVLASCRGPQRTGRRAAHVLSTGWPATLWLVQTNGCTHVGVCTCLHKHIKHTGTWAQELQSVTGALKFTLQLRARPSGKVLALSQSSLACPATYGCPHMLAAESLSTASTPAHRPFAHAELAGVLAGRSFPMEPSASLDLCLAHCQQPACQQHCSQHGPVSVAAAAATVLWQARTPGLTSSAETSALAQAAKVSQELLGAAQQPWQAGCSFPWRAAGWRARHPLAPLHRRPG